jgi:hypothetical protein
VAIIRPPLPQLAFTMIPNAWVRDPELDANAFRILADILSHAEGYRLSVAQIMRETGIGRDGVEAAIKRMKIRGYLVAVEQARADRGRFGENDYTVTSVTDRVPPRPPEEQCPDQPEIPGANVGISPSRSGTATVRDRDGARPPRKKNTSGEDQLIPSGSAAEAGSTSNGNGHQPTINQRAKILTDEHYDACGRLENWPAVRGIVVKALSAGHHDEAIRKALADLRGSGVSVVTATLRNALERPGSGGRGQPRNPSGRTQWVLPERGSYTEPEDGVFR